MRQLRRSQRRWWRMRILAATSALTMSARGRPAAGSKVTRIAVLDASLPHEGEPRERTSLLVNQYACTLHARADYRRRGAADAARLSTRRTSAPTIPGSPADLNNLAALLVRHQSAARREPLMRQRAEIVDEIALRPDRIKVSHRRLNSLAQLLQATSRLVGAEPLMRRALAIGEASFGPDHPNVASGDLNDLAQLFQDTGRRRRGQAAVSRRVAPSARASRPRPI